MLPLVIAALTIRNFKALRNTHLDLQPFNLVIGANGSGKTSLIQILLRLRTLAQLPLNGSPEERIPQTAEIDFRFRPPHEDLEIVMSCVADTRCDLLQVIPLHQGTGEHNWDALRNRLLGIRAYLFDHYSMTRPVVPEATSELLGNGANLAAVLNTWRAQSPDAYAAFCAETLRIFPEYSGLDIRTGADTRLSIHLKLADGNTWIDADALSQGTLYLLALIALAHAPSPPSLICIEELDRGIHPRLLREARDLLYRLSYPRDFGSTHAPVQVIATTHSPYLLDLFKDAPEEVVIATKRGIAATFSRLADRPDLRELLNESSLGDLWFSGILGGVPEER